MNENETINIGCGCLNFWNLLTIIFVIAKITNHLSWTWGKVFIPTYIWLGLCVLWGIMKAIKDSL